MIQQTGPLDLPRDGFEQVNSHVDGDFAFIHDASEVRYMYYKNCNFTEVGEAFAEQPVAVAVQQVHISCVSPPGIPCVAFFSSLPMFLFDDLGNHGYILELETS